MVLASVLLGLAACRPAELPAPAYETLRGEGLGTTWTVTWTAPVLPDRDAVQAAVVGALQDVDEGMSTWRDDSDLARVRSGVGPVRVREDTADVVRAALTLAETTGGAFDPTVQPLMELWGLHGAPRSAWPTPEELAEARAQVGWSRVRVARDDTGATVDAGGTALDLSAIAKGHAVDRVAHAVGRLGATSWFVEIGGEVRASGVSQRGEPWSVGIEAPVAEGRELMARVRVTQGAVATSGNYRSAYEVDGKTVHHTLDPRTGLPAAAPMRSATVFAPTCREADGWATALMVLGEAGLPLIEARPDVEAWLLTDDDVPVGTSGASSRIEPLGDVLHRD